jgi:hypothetical protein
MRTATDEIALARKHIRAVNARIERANDLICRIDALLLEAQQIVEEINIGVVTSNAEGGTRYLQIDDLVTPAFIDKVALIEEGTK